MESDELDKIITPETFKKTQKLIIEKVVLASVPNIQGNGIIQDNVVKRKFVKKKYFLMILHGHFTMIY